jgi:hypothetical protein
MTKFLGVLLGSILLAGCSAPARMDLTVRNTLPLPVRLRASAGGFERTISLAPHGTWTGWVPTAWAREIEIEVLP